MTKEYVKTELIKALELLEKLPEDVYITGVEIGSATTEQRVNIRVLRGLDEIAAGFNAAIEAKLSSTGLSTRLSVVVDGVEIVEWRRKEEC